MRKKKDLPSALPLSQTPMRTFQTIGVGALEVVSVAMFLEKKEENPDGWREKVKQKGCSLAKGVAWLAKSISSVSLFLYALQSVPVEKN